VRQISDTFDLVSAGAGVTVTRTTVVETKGRFQSLKRIALYFSLKQVHRYVFRNWVRSAIRQSPTGRARESGSPTSPTL
jgi:hypothetical protein